MDLQTGDLRLFVECVNTGSVSAAAKRVGLTQAVASRHLRRLEESVGGPVLFRTTRALRTTPRGQRLLEHARVMLGELTAFTRALTPQVVAGTISVSAPVLLGQALGGSMAAALRKQHPELRVRLSLDNARVDLVRTEVDLALRVGPLPDTSMIATRLADAHIGAYTRGPVPASLTHPRDMVGLPWVGHPAEREIRAHHVHGGRWRGAPSYVFESDDRAVLRDACLHGVGFALLPTFWGEQTAGLQRVLPEWHFGRAPIHALWLPEAKDDPRIRAVARAVMAWGKTQRW